MLKLKDWFANLNNTKKIAIITFFSNLYFYNHIGTLYQQTRGLSLLQVNSIWSIIVGTMFLTEIPTGVIADKLGRKWAIVIALGLQFIGEVLYLFARNYLFFAFIAVIAGIGYAFSSGCTEALIYDSLSGENRERKMKKAMGLNGAAYQFAFFLAPLIGGLVVSELILEKFLLAILLTAGSIAVAFMLSFTLKEPKKEYLHEEDDPLVLLKDGINLLKENKRLQKIVAISVLTFAFFNSLVSFYQPYFVKANVSPFWIGGALSIGALMAFAGEKYAYKIEEVLGSRLGLFIPIILPGFMYLLLASILHPLWTVLIFILTYGSMNIKSPLLSAYQNELIQSKNRATVLSLINMFLRFYEAIVGLVIGAIADIAIPYAFIFIGMIIIISSILLHVDKLATIPAKCKS